MTLLPSQHKITISGGADDEGWMQKVNEICQSVASQTRKRKNELAVSRME
jgi:hypothetical protein